MSGMYELFKTDANLEKNGIIIDYGNFRVTISRAGGANHRFKKIAEAKTKPVRRALQTDTLDQGRQDAIMQEIFAEAVILKWEVKTTDPEGKEQWEVGIEGPDGDTIAFNKENVLATFKALPDLFIDLQEQSTKTALFREATLEDELKN